MGTTWSDRALGSSKLVMEFRVPLCGLLLGRAPQDAACSTERVCDINGTLWRAKEAYVAKINVAGALLLSFPQHPSSLASCSNLSRDR